MRPSDFRLVTPLILQDQNVVGRGAVGFDLAKFDSGAPERERARAKEFVLRATAAAAPQPLSRRLREVTSHNTYSGCL
ncbi:hypothetical protein ACIQU3_04930 [Streptomyces sp. NPDC101110]|uniref:hypothetical protein n=1 Tax=Streptomyces sp. NPDC101110 TaxID=3366104 RepID=UPI003830355A